jgi:hypothetical protein
MMAKTYSKLLLRFGLGKFRALEALGIIGAKNPYLILHRLCRNGYLVRGLQRGF